MNVLIIYQLMMDTNYFGSVNMTTCVVNDMIERANGHIVFVSSIGGQVRGDIFLLLSSIN